MPRLATALVLLLLSTPLLPQGQGPSSAQLKRAIDLAADGKGEAALPLLKPLAQQFPAIADYIALATAQAQASLKDHAAVAAAVEPVFRTQPDSPLAGQAALLAANSLIESGNPRGAITMLARIPQTRLPMPDSMALLGKARELAGDPVAAALAYQQVYFYYPQSPLASAAASALSRLEASLGPAYPPPMPRSRFERASKLLSARRYADARSEYREMVSLFDGPEREIARVRAAASLHLARKDSDAFSELSSIDARDTEANAERLYYLAAAARRLDRDSDMERALAELATAAPASKWRLQALVSAGDRYLVDNRTADYLPHYRACAASFPGIERGAYCHWKVVWSAWMDRSPQAIQLLQDHLRLFPSSEKAGAALYWLGSSAHSSRDFASARAYFEELQAHFPSFFYSVLAREALARQEVASAPRSSQAASFLSTLKLPDRERAPDFTPSPAARKRMERATILRRAGLDRLAETELRFGARNGDSPWVLAMDLAETAAARGDHAMSIRYIKGTVPGYLFLPRDAAPLRFWKLAFPFPYRDLIERHARARSIEPFLLAALIRQESEFDPDVVSAAGAIGLTQVMPATGRGLARRLKIGYRTSYLKRADYNLRLGTYFMGSLFERFDNRLEEVLAAYNAGPSRPPKWREWGQFRTPEEFIETIPFTQTRDYVQIIRRNADIYRWLYASTSPAPAPAVASAPKPAPQKAVQSSSSKSTKKATKKPSRVRKRK